MAQGSPDPELPSLGTLVAIIFLMLHYLWKIHPKMSPRDSSTSGAKETENIQIRVHGSDFVDFWSEGQKMRKLEFPKTILAQPKPENI